jgi:hypothetical protein
MSRAADDAALHLVSPRVASWNTIFAEFARRMDVPLVPFDEWIVALHAAARDIPSKDHSPAMNLLDFFQRGNFADMRLSTELAVRASPTLAKVQPLDEEDAARYLAYWKKIGFV